MTDQAIDELKLDRVVRDAKDLRGISGKPILSPFAEPNRAQASQRTIRALQDGIAKISEVLKDPKANLSADKINDALAEQASLVEDLNKAYKDLEINLFLDSIDSLKSEVRDINAEAGFGLVTPLQAAQREFSAAITPDTSITRTCLTVARRVKKRRMLIKIQRSEPNN